jgi:hypothetical protein
MSKLALPWVGGDDPGSLWSAAVDDGQNAEPVAAYLGGALEVVSEDVV